MVEPISLERRELLMACDGRKLLILRNEGNGRRPSLAVEHVQSREDEPTRALASDKPGRLQAFAGGPRSAVEQTDFHTLEEEAFLLRAVRTVEEMALAGKVESLIVAAPPRALGVLRKIYPARVKKVVRAEIAADLVHMPKADIEEYFHTANKNYPG